MEGLNGGKGVSQQSSGVVLLVHTLYSRALHGDYVRTLRSSTGWSEKARVVRWNSHSDNQGTANVKEENAPEDTTNGLDDVAAGALSFRSSATLR